MIEIERLAQLASAVKVKGGIRAVAQQAELDPSNVSKFLRTARGLSSESIRALETVLGRTGGRIPETTIVCLSPKRADDDLARALAWYFVDGAEVARASWTGLMWENVKKLLNVRLVPEIYAFRDDHGARLVVTLPAGLILPQDFFGSESPSLRWNGDDRQQAVLEIGESVHRWLDGGLDPATFDEAWPSKDYERSSDDLIEHVRRLQITWAEAIRRVTFNS